MLPWGTLMLPEDYQKHMFCRPRLYEPRGSRRSSTIKLSCIIHIFFYIHICNIYIYIVHI